MKIRPLRSNDLERVRGWLAKRWGAACIAVHGRLYRPEDLAGFVAEDRGAWKGLATYVLDRRGCEIVSLDSAIEGRGVGTALVRAVARVAAAARVGRLWCVTTNDNVEALRFWQRRGFALVAVHRGAVAAARRLKPAIPRVGASGIPIRDEIELERRTLRRLEAREKAPGPRGTPRSGASKPRATRRRG